LVSLPTGARPPYETANEVFRAQWGNTMAWSTMLAVAVHAAAFAFWPSWDVSDSLLDPDLELQGTAWMVLYAPPSSGGNGGVAVASLALLAESDSLPIEDADSRAIVGGSELAQARRSAGLRERLAGRDSPAPTLVQFSPATGPPGVSDDPGDTREEMPTVEEAPAEDLALMIEASPLDLSRLSGVRPQIVLPGTSAWIMIRNPSEVDRFMNGVAYSADSEAEGLVDVAVWIDEWGSVEWAEISRSSGHQEMDEIALALFNEVASFRPARDQGVRVSMSVIFSVPFPW
jgi:TonB family protein